jgi:hypothetical protein
MSLKLATPGFSKLVSGEQPADPYRATSHRRLSDGLALVPILVEVLDAVLGGVRRHALILSVIETARSPTWKRYVARPVKRPMDWPFVLAFHENPAEVLRAHHALPSWPT